MKMLMLLALLTGVFGPIASAQSVNAASCNASDVQAALNSVSANGTTVNIPAGSCAWTQDVSLSTSLSITIEGQSTIATTSGSGNLAGNPATFSDTTLITDSRTGTVNSVLFQITETGGSSQVVRVTGISFNGGTVTQYNGILAINGGSSAVGQARIDHNHFINVNYHTMSIALPTKGVIDHNLVDVPNGAVNNGVGVSSVAGDGLGNTAWAQAPPFGTGNATYIENNTWNNGFMNDCTFGGSYVARYNTYNVLATNANIGIQSHATGSNTSEPARGCRSWEVYGNVIGGGGGTITYAAGFETSGTGLWWGNTIVSTGIIPAQTHDLAFKEDRDDNSTYSQSAPPNGWGYCGTAQTGGASSWDDNLNANGSNGWPCLDQIGRGQGDLLSGVFPVALDTLNPGITTGIWPHEVSQPVYIWNETFSGTASLINVQSSENNIQANRDYYGPVSGAQTSPTSPFNGTANTGWGTLANRPTTCTPMVAYWAIDQNTLYQCQSTNTWAGYYSPYTYPHPLVTGGTSSAPVAPTNLTAGVE